MSRSKTLLLRAMLGAITGLAAVGVVADSGIRLKKEPPPGFENLSAPQSTQADIYFGGQFLTSTFIVFDLESVEFADPLSVVENIPNLRDPQSIADELKGRVPNNAQALCTIAKREACGRLEPPTVAVIFDESRFRIDLFVNPSQLLVHEIQRDRYLPLPTARSSLLHNVRTHAAGSGSDRRFSIGTESFFAYEQSRIRARHTFSNSGFELNEFSWQRDGRDVEYEFGSFRASGSRLSFASDVDVAGFRVSTSTKSRMDLADALATPVMLFLAERSRVDVLRGNELLDTRYYDAGNQEIDTASFPDGAYQLTLRVISPDGSERTHEQFFVRSRMMAPIGEPQYYFESGVVANPEGRLGPRLSSHKWVRSGGRYRMAENFAVDHEFVHVAGENMLQLGALYMRPTWHVQASVLESNKGTSAFGLTGGYRHGDIGLFVDYRQVDLQGGEVSIDQFALYRSDYRLGTLTVSLPTLKGQLFLRARVSERDNGGDHVNDSGIGVSYWGRVFERDGIAVNLTLDTHYSSEQRWIRAGVNVRWRNGREYASVRPQLEYSRGRIDDFNASLEARWNRRGVLPRLGEFDEAFYLTHDAHRQAIGARFVPTSNTYSDYELRYQRDDFGADFYYSANNSFSVVTTNGHTTFGDGGHSVGAVVIDIQGQPVGRFDVLVDNRVVGSAWAGRRNVVSLRPYANYDVRIRPVGNRIVGYDQQSQRVTLYPGNVETLTFNVRELVVIISQAVFPDGSPVSRGRFVNVEGYGATDEQGWFQVEVGHGDALRVETASGPCEITLPQVLPDRHSEQGLTVIDTVECLPVVTDT